MAVPAVAVETGEEAPSSPLADLINSCPVEAAEYAKSPVGVAQVQEFYRYREFQPQWQDVTQRQQLAGLLDELRYDGLQPAQYLTGLSLNEFGSCTDSRITHDYLLALHHLQNGLLNQAKVEPYWIEEQAQIKKLPTPAQLAVQAGQDLAGSFEAARPQHALYTRLREQLRAGRLLHQHDWPKIPTGKSLRPDMRDSRVSLLRERLLQGGYLAAMEGMQEIETTVELERYDQELVSAVKAFQADHYLEEDGIIGPATLRELNVTPQRRLSQIRLNLERLRWLESYLEEHMLIVDIAGARLMYLENGTVTWRTRTQVGTTRRQTPLLKSRITHLTMNPTWTVPPTILRNDKLPAVQKDIGYLARNRMQVLDAQGRVLDPYEVDWSAPGNVMLRQAAGPGNALGRVAIRFANPFTVYLHDTPSQYLFGRSTRTVSSGCVRVEEVFSLLDLLAPDETTNRRISGALNSGRTQQVNLAEAVPVLLAYWTVDVDMDGRLRFRPDSYGHDERLAVALEKALARN